MKPDSAEPVEVSWNSSPVAGRNWRATLLLLLTLLPLQVLPATYPDRFVWIFGWGLGKDDDVDQVIRVLDTAAKHQLNGAVCSFGLEGVGWQNADYLRRLEAIQQACARNRLELIPALFSIGYGGGILGRNPNLAEGLEVVGAPFVVAGGAARFVPDAEARIVNGDFEDLTGNKFAGFAFHDQPGEVSFADREVKHGGRSSLRLENFTANPHGHGRVMATVKVKAHRCYRVSLWVKTADLQPSGAFRCLVLANNRDLAPRTFQLPPTADWRKLSFIFNSLEHEKVNLYAGLWGGKTGKVWLDDWSIEDAGPVNVLHRPGTPVTVQSEDGATNYVEGRDYSPPRSPDFNVWRGDATPARLKLLPDSRLREGQRLRVSWYHPLLLHDSQVTVCLAEPELYEIMDQGFKAVVEKLHPKRVLLGTDEVRMGGTCRACAGRDMAQLIGECITKQVNLLQHYSPDTRVYVWSDMFDPSHNAHPEYYLVRGDFTGSWKHIPKDVVMAVWGGEPREQSLRFFADQGFATLIACYYDAENLDGVKSWMTRAQPFANVRGFMYTPWERKYALLPAFGDLLREQ